MMNDKNLNAKAPEVRRILSVMLKVENLHIHLDERSTNSTYSMVPRIRTRSLISTSRL